MSILHIDMCLGNAKTEVREMEELETIEEPISKAYPVIDTDLARDNLENDLTAADLQDL